MIIRAATEGDLPGVFAIYDHEVLHGTATFDTQPKTPAERLEWFRNDDNGRYPILVAADAGAIAGWTRLYPRTPCTSIRTSAAKAWDGHCWGSCCACRRSAGCA